MLVVCFGGITVASKTYIRLLAAAESHSSVSSGVSAVPWLGHPWRLVGPFWKPATSTRCNIFPVLQSPTSKPSNSFTLTKHSVWLPLIVNGRIELLNGPTVLTAVWVLVSATESSRECSPARYAREPSGP